MSIMYASSSEVKKSFVLNLLEDNSIDRGIIEEWLTYLLEDNSSDSGIIEEWLIYLRELEKTE